MFGCITSMLKGMFDCNIKDVWLYYWVCLKGCLVVLLSMLKGMFGCITMYA